MMEFGLVVVVVVNTVTCMPARCKSGLPAWL